MLPSSPVRNAVFSLAFVGYVGSFQAMPAFGALCSTSITPDTASMPSDSLSMSSEQLGSFFGGQFATSCAMQSASSETVEEMIAEASMPSDPNLHLTPEQLQLLQLQLQQQTEAERNMEIIRVIDAIRQAVLSFFEITQQPVE